MADEKGNTGNWNTGDMNTGNWNTGDMNTGDMNTGDMNTGNRNTGDMNTGNRNPGDMNTGNWNTGNWNTGNWNTGDMNTGDMNTGNRNTGYMNTGDRNTGIFNTNAPKMRAFNRGCEFTMTEFRDKHGYSSLDIYLTQWIESKDMTAEEKNKNPHFELLGGFLRKHDYKTAWANAWATATPPQKKWFLDLPNFDAAIFLDVTGIDVRENTHKTELLKKADELIRKAEELRAEASKL
jgi:hypothetical protein